MTRQFLRFVVLTALALAFTHQAWAVAITKVPFETSGRSAWAEVIEVEDPSVIKSGYTIFSDVGPEPWSKVYWLMTFGSYLEAVFTVPADTLIVQFESDRNDGIAEFFVDGVSVGTYDTNSPLLEGWYGLEISGLTFAAHTLRVQAVSTSPPDDLAIDVFGAIAASPPVPEPAILALLGFGFGGIGFARRKKTH